MIDPIFKVNDFLNNIGSGDSRITVFDAVESANKRIEKLLGPVVFGDLGYSGWINDLSHSPKNQTHTARLFNVQEIKKVEPCDHKPIVGFDNRFGIYLGNRPVCEKCRKNLKATWAVDE